MWRARRREENIEVNGQKFTIYEFTLLELYIYSSFSLAEDNTKLFLLFPQNNILTLSEEEKSTLFQRVEEINKEIPFPKKSFPGKTIKLTMEEVIVSFAEAFHKDPLSVINKYTKNQLLYWQYIWSSLHNAFSDDSLPDPKSRKPAPKTRNARKAIPRTSNTETEISFDRMMQQTREVKNK